METVFNEIMMDFETMGVGPSAAVVQLGAVAFNRLTGEMAPAVFLQDIDLLSSINLGGEVDRSTARWWKERGGFHPVRTVVCAEEAFSNFSGYVKTFDHPELRVWARGASFDIAIAENHYRWLGRETPWKYSRARDTRTIEDFAKEFGWEPPPAETTHQALQDAQDQVRQLYSAMKYLRDRLPNGDPFP